MQARNHRCGVRRSSPWPWRYCGCWRTRPGCSSSGLLLEQEKSVSELAAALDKPVPGVSQHLAKMRMARLVTTRRQGTSVLYRVENGHVRQLVIDTLGHVEHLLDDVPAHHRTAEERS